MLHAKVNAVVLLRFVNEEIFQRIVAVGWGKRFFADLAVNRTGRMWRFRPHADELISRWAFRAKENGAAIFDRTRLRLPPWAGRMDSASRPRACKPSSRSVKVVASQYSGKTAGPATNACSP